MDLEVLDNQWRCLSGMSSVGKAGRIDVPELGEELVKMDGGFGIRKGDLEIDRNILPISAITECAVLEESGIIGLIWRTEPRKINGPQCRIITSF